MGLVTQSAHELQPLEKFETWRDLQNVLEERDAEYWAEVADERVKDA